MDADVLLLSRIQFAFTIGFHILFPTLTIGLGAFLLVLEAQWLRTKKELYYRLYRFWARVFALGFGVGVVSGIVLSYQVGTNWSRYSEITGNVLGPLLSYEVLTAFFLEAGFLGIMLFGWSRVGPGLHFLATAMVALGTTFSAFWILSANSWMQTPAGHALAESGRFVVADWWAVIFNPSFPYRFAHMVTAAFLTTSFVVAGVSAWHLLQVRHVAVSWAAFSLAMWMAVVTAPLQIVLGDLHGLNTRRHQPMKVAAMEALWETRREVPLLLFAVPDQEAAANRYEIGIPNAGSLILTHSLDGEVKGLGEVPPQDRPPVAIVFHAFRIMVGIGVVFLVLAVVGLFLRLGGRLYDRRWFLWSCVFASPLGFVAVLAGWTVTEVGRQPWTVYGLVRTADSVSPIASGAAATSLALFMVVYTVLLVAFLIYFFRLVSHGPEYESELPHFQDRSRAIMHAAE